MNTVYIRITAVFKAYCSKIDNVDVIVFTD